MTRAIVLTSTALRHQYVANALSERFELVGIWQEERTFRPERHAETEEDLVVIGRHFAARDTSESLHFEGHRQLHIAANGSHRWVPAGHINDPGEAALMRNLAPDVMFVYGTSILREQILDQFPGRIINLHLGLSPYYRGSGTNFWPLVNNEPEYVGATVHLIDEGADTGPIVSHSRPQIEIGDTSHDIGNKAVKVGAAALMDAGLALLDGNLHAARQSGSGRVYRRAQFNAKAVRKMHANFELGMIDEYLENKAERDAALDLVEMQVIR